MKRKIYIIIVFVFVSQYFAIDMQNIFALPLHQNSDTEQTTMVYKKEISRYDQADIPESKIEYYADGINSIELSSIPSVLDFKLPLFGYSKYSILLISINSPKKKRKFLLRLKNTKFKYYYLLKDGRGQYTITIYGNNNTTQRFKGLCSFSVSALGNIESTNSILFINDKITNFAHKHLNRQVGRGECWDLAQEALEGALADWTRPFSFGRLLNVKTEEVLPGDIIQIKSLILTKQSITNVNGHKAKRTTIQKYGLPDHTAIIKKVLATNVYEVYHQNVQGKRYVMEGILDLNLKTSGQIWFYRPQAGCLEIQ